jgi:hypothetical protein
MVGLAFTPSVARSQLTGGLAAGVKTGAVKISEIPSGFASTIRGNNIFGFEAGVFARLDLQPFYIKPQALLDYRNGTVYVYQQDAVLSSDDFTMTRLQVPVLFGLNLIGPLCLEAGPVYHYLIHTSDRFGNPGGDIALRRGGLGYRAGLNAQWDRLNLFVSYQGVTLDGSQAKGTAKFQSPDELLFGLGILLGKTD